jgi:hypothetical protein
VPECTDAKAGHSVFTVSYSTLDSREQAMGKVIKRVAERVRSELGYRGATPIFYRDDYQTNRGPGWEEGLVQALCRCAVVVAFYSPTYFSELSDPPICCYCGREIGIFAAREPRRPANVVPVLWDVPSGGVRKMVPAGMTSFTWVLDAEIVTEQVRQQYETRGLRWIWSRQDESKREDLTLAIAQKILSLHTRPSPPGNDQTTLAAAQCAFHPAQHVNTEVSELARRVSEEPADPGTLILVYLSDAPLSQAQQDQLEQHGRSTGYLVLVCHLPAHRSLEEITPLTKQNGPVIICAPPEALAGSLGQGIQGLLADPDWLGGVLLSERPAALDHLPAEGVTVSARPDDLTDALGQAIAGVKRRLMRLGGDNRLGVAGPPLPRL